MLIGRKDELTKLKEAYESEYSEFIAVYGRRRVGKTFLIREAFNYNFTFSHTGISQKNTRAQFKEFHQSLKRHGAENSAVPVNWQEAFDSLISLLERSNDRRKVVFIDEMPWMDAPRSGFLPALEHFWNGWATSRRDILLIVCGSATSWIINKILKNHGGLHNRVSIRLHLKPFTLHECSGYAAAKKLTMSRMQIAEAYMVMGGIPFYWSKLDKSRSLAQNIDNLFFSSDGELRHEFGELYASLFKRPEKYLRIIEVLALRKAGVTRGEIALKGRLDDNGQLSRMLEELSYCGFIRKYCHIGKKVKDAIYQLTDNYTLFYYQFIKNNPSTDDNFWMKTIGRPAYNTWCGLAFERLCMAHSRQIKAALGISGILATIYSWHTAPSDGKPGAQIDMLIDRADNVLDICEMKYSQTPYAITSAYRTTLLNKAGRLSEAAAGKRAVHIVMVTANGLVHNQYSDIINNEITLEDLFRE